MEYKTYRKRQLLNEGIRYTGNNARRVAAFCGPDLIRTPYRRRGSSPLLQVYSTALRSWWNALEGDWVMRGQIGQFFPCSQEVFEKSYEPLGRRKFRKRPIVAEALRWTGENIGDIESFCYSPSAYPQERARRHYGTLQIWSSLHFCWVNAPVGSWVVQGVAGEVYPCNPMVFARTFEELDPEESAYARGDVEERDRFTLLT